MTPVLDILDSDCSSLLARATKHFRLSQPSGIKMTQPAGYSEDNVDQQLKELMKELGEAINESLSESEPISAVVSRIKEEGYEVFLVLEATIGVGKKGEKLPDKASVVSAFSKGTPGIGENVRVGPTKPDGTPHPSAGKTGRVRQLLTLDDQMRAVVEVENDFILVPVESLVVSQQPPMDQGSAGVGA
jgi:hypothetical protein